MVSGTCLRIVVFPSNLEHNRICFLQCVYIKNLQVSLIIHVSRIISKSNKPYSWCKKLFYRVSVHQWAKQWHNYCATTELSMTKMSSTTPVQFKTLSQNSWFSHRRSIKTTGFSDVMLCSFVYGINISEETVAAIFTACCSEDVGSCFLCNTGFYLDNWSHPRGLLILCF